MRLRVVTALAVLAALLAACGGDSGSGDSATRTVLTDYDLDEFAVSSFGYFPRVISVHPGDTIVFKQAWTGEPHTVTLGHLIDDAAAAIKPYITGDGKIDQNNTAAIDAAEGGLPSVFDQADNISQTIAAPCYIESGAIPTDAKACPRRSQPDFTGREQFFNSGFIPYKGNDGNRFRMRLAADIAPADYYYYCALHGITMGGFLRVVPKSQTIETQAAVNRRARKELDTTEKILRNGYKNMTEYAGMGGDIVAGVFSADVEDGFQLPFGVVNEFKPRTFRTTVGKKVTWVVPAGPGHTISFHVPKYLPAIEISPNRTKLNRLAYDPQGGPGYPHGYEGEEPVAVDVGNYDGSFFLSSGYPDSAMRYSVTFAKAGTYDYACLLHPRMVAKVVVEE